MEPFFDFPVRLHNVVLEDRYDLYLVTHGYTRRHIETT